MRNSTKVLTAVAVAGLAFAGGSAFTGAGLSTSGAASSPQFVGGTVTQNVTGATLSNIAYGFVGGSTGPQTEVNSVSLTFADALSDGKAVSISLNGGASIPCGPITTAAASCDLTTAPVSGVDSIAVTVS